jgi:DNA-binding beta-propeller fold protein YncE
MTTGSAFVPDNPSMKNSKPGTQNDIRLTRLTRHTRLIFFAGVLAALVQPLCAQTLTPQPPVELANTHGKFDFIKVDSARGRLLACHTGNGSLDVIDESTSKLLKSIPTGAAQGVAIDDKGGRYFVSVSKPAQLVIIDATKLEATGTVALPEAADLCAYSPKLDWVIVDDDEKGKMWTVDLKMMAVLHQCELPQETGMEDLAFDSTGTFFVQNIKGDSKLWVLDYAAFPIFAETAPVNGNNPMPEISTLPAANPHGLAMAGDDRVLVSGGVGKLALINYRTGKLMASCDIAPRVDEIAYDPSAGKAFCASGTGVISVVSVGKDTLGKAENIPSAQGAHSIAVDSKTHTVWIAFAKDDKAYVQAFLAGVPK